MQSKRVRPPFADAWQGDEASWPALLASIGINVLAWTALSLIYQRARDDLRVADQPRTPIVWLKGERHASRDVGSGYESSKPARGSTTQPRIMRQAVAQVLSRPIPLAAAPPTSSPPMPSSADVDDAWYSSQQEIGEAKLDRGSLSLFRPDPLRLHRATHFPAQVARLKLRMVSAGGPAANAQMKVCGALLTQWEGLRMNASTDQAPLGMQPAGRQAVWRTLQQEGCLD